MMCLSYFFKETEGFLTIFNCLLCFKSARKCRQHCQLLHFFTVCNVSDTVKISVILCHRVDVTSECHWINKMTLISRQICLRTQNIFKICYFSRSTLMKKIQARETIPLRCQHPAALIQVRLKTKSLNAV